MKTRLMLLWLCLALASVVWGQEKPHFIRLGLGPSQPMGAYGSHTKGDRLSDYAGIGLAANLEGAFFFHKNWGIGVNVQYANHFGNSKKATEGYNRKFTFSDNYDFFFEPKSFRMFTVMGGLYYSNALNDKLRLYANVGAGYLSGYLPALPYTRKDDGLRGLINFPQAKTSFAWQIGTSVVWKANKNWDMGVQANWTAGKPKFEYSSNANILQDNNYNVNYLSLLYTIAYRFN